MRRRFFVNQFDDQHAVMQGEPAHHLGRVLRAQPGQLYELSDGTSVWLGRIDIVTRDRIDFALLEQLPGYVPELQTTLLLSVVKFDVFEWALEKATELGIARIVPLASARSDKALLAAAAKRADRWKKILLESSQQSRRVQLPVLDPLAKPEAAFNSFGQGIRILLSESPDAPSLRKTLSGARESIAALWPSDRKAAGRTPNTPPPVPPASTRLRSESSFSERKLPSSPRSPR